MLVRNFRRFYRYPSNSFCIIETEGRLIKAFFVDYSQMGCLLRIDKLVPLKKHIALIYPDDQSEFVKMAGYSVHLQEKHGLWYLGIKFTALLSR